MKLWRLKDEKSKDDETCIERCKRETGKLEGLVQVYHKRSQKSLRNIEDDHNRKTTWWRNEEVKVIIKVKRRLYKVCLKKKDQQSKEKILGYEKDS